MSDQQIIDLYNANATTAQIAAALDCPQWQVADTLARLRPSGVLRRRKRTTREQARKLLIAAGADFDALSTSDPTRWQPEAARLLDAGIAPSQLARFTAVSKARVCAWARRRAQ
jgi:thiamine pyrophosphate-dependent acetolactate synthase large subunit-like protein